MRVTPKISDIPTETRNRNIPTLRPLSTCTVTSGPFVIQANEPVAWALLLLVGGHGPELGDLVAALHQLTAVMLLDVAEHGLAVGVHLHDPDPLRGNGLLITPAHDHLAPRELHLVTLAERGDDLVGVVALRPLDGLRDDVGARVAPGGAERGLLLRARLVLLHPLEQLGVTLLHAVVVPGEAGRHRADRRFLAQRVQLVRVAHGGADEVDLLEQAEGPG